MENSANNANQFNSSLDIGEIRTNDSNCDNTEIMMGSETNDIIK